MSSAVDHTSDSSPLAPSFRASANALRVFSAACALAPRCAKAIGSSSREGRRCCTGRTLGTRFYAGDVFNLSGSEILFLLVAGLVVLGPERLPAVIRRVMRAYNEFRNVAASFEKEFRETFDEPLKELKSTAEDLRGGFGQVDPDPSPPMRPEQATLPPEDGSDDAI